MKKITKWKTVSNIINKTKIGETITRKQIMFKIYGDSKPDESYGLPPDRYRRALEMIGFLEIVDRGVYKVLAHIKPQLTTYKLMKHAYSYDHSEWFHDFKEYE